MSIETEKLIDAVRQYSFLYDTSDVNYKDKATKTHVWSEIAAELEMESGDVAKTKWRNLKDSYLKYKRNIENASEHAKNNCGQVYYKKYQKWPWADRMEFLEGHYGRRQKSKSKRLKSTEPLQPSVSMVKTENSITECKRKISPSDSPVNIMIDYLDKKKKEGDGQNHIDNLFLSYADTFKKLSPQSQIDLKLKMAQMFAEAEMQEIKCSNIQQESPSSPHSN